MSVGRHNFVQSLDGSGSRRPPCRTAADPWRALSVRRIRPTGFSLVELMISLTLIMILTLALLTSFTFIARGDQSLANYGEMNAQARKLLEQIGRDLRTATDVTNFTATSLTITVPTNTAGTATQDVIWSYDSVSRTVSRHDTTSTKQYARDVEIFSFYYYNSASPSVETTSLVEVKQVQLRLRMLRLVASSITSEYVISSQFTMRAKSTAH